MDAFLRGSNDQEDVQEWLSALQQACTAVIRWTIYLIEWLSFIGNGAVFFISCF